MLISHKHKNVYLLDEAAELATITYANALISFVFCVGDGPVVWFQKFEYAVGHWLQKTAEHVLGCVLCSPGCFSLFRGAALVDVNVMNQYTTKATEARHYVQWDQGKISALFLDICPHFTSSII